MRQILYPGAKIPEGYNQNPAGDVELTTGPGPIEKAGYRGPQPTEQQIEALASGRITNEELFNQLNPPPEPTSLAVPSMDRLSAQRPGVPTTGFQPAGRVPSPQYGQPQSQGIRPQNNYRLMPPPPPEQAAPPITPPGALPEGVPYRPEFIPELPFEL